VPNQRTFSSDTLQQVATLLRCGSVRTVEAWLHVEDRSVDLTPQLAKIDTFDGAFRIVVESQPGTHVRIDAIEKARRLARNNEDRRLLFSQIGRESVQRINVMRDMAEEIESK
jgi:hypothetical protein